MNDWQPIETAPKDGTEVLLWGRCERDGQFFAYDCNVGWYDDGSIGDKGWTARDLPIEPSHWMPLPKPPTAITAPPPEQPSTNPAEGVRG